MITVRLFARLREQLGLSRVELEPAALATAADVRAALARRYGEHWQQQLGADQIIVAVNQEVADWQSPVTDGDEVAFFPPVTGG